MVRVVGHLRAVKDPFLAARAVRELPPESTLRVEHIGACLEPQLAEQARVEERSNPRWRWLGPLSRRETLRQIASAHVLVSTSRSEGGPSVLAEALLASTPIVSTRTDGALGMLGAGHPGLFDVGDEAALRRLLLHAEADANFLSELQAAGDLRRGAFSRELERAALRDLLAGLDSSPTAG